MLKIEAQKELTRQIWIEVWDQIEHFHENVDNGGVVPRLNVQQIKDTIKCIDLENGVDPERLIQFSIQNLRRYNIHNHNSSNFGVYGNGINTLGISIEALLAAFNPQLATWIQSPFAAELESYVIRLFGKKFGMDGGVDGCFTNNDAEANQTAILAALSAKFQNFKAGGIHQLRGLPVLYVSKGVHPSMVKAARMCGIGTSGLRMVPDDEDKFMDTAALDGMIRDDIKCGHFPFMVIGTAGSIVSGSIDPLLELSAIAKHFKLWCHIDVGYGGSALFQSNLDVLLEGIESCDSLAIDISKFLSLPSDSFMFITRQGEVLEDTFGHDENYLPNDAFAVGNADGFARTMQWSRRFSGLKAFIALAQHGWSGYKDIHKRQNQVAWFLREKLEETGWTIVNKTLLSVVCFNKPHLTIQDLSWICQDVIASGRAWLSVVSLDHDVYCLRASTTNFKTTELEVIALVESLEEAEEKIWLRQNRIPEL